MGRRLVLIGYEIPGLLRSARMREVWMTQVIGGLRPIRRSPLRAVGCFDLVSPTGITCLMVDRLVGGIG